MESKFTFEEKISIVVLLFVILSTVFGITVMYQANKQLDFSRQQSIYREKEREAKSDSIEGKFEHSVNDQSR